MCGIAGFLHASETHRSEASLHEICSKMAASLHRRGPDDADEWVDAEHGVALGHRRLAVQDLSPAGRQPMHSHSGRFVIAFNGEVYNHLELRDELSRQGLEAPWRGTSDTETLLAGFDAWGVTDTLVKAVGMFAFALWDRETRKLTLGRDRFGEKPLYYGWQGAHFLFGSELKALGQSPAFNASISRQSLEAYLRLGYIRSPASIFEGIYKLEPGTTLTLDASDRQGTVARFWDAGAVIAEARRTPFAGSFDDAVVEADRLLSTAVSRQLISDVAIGAFLSGGVDSSSIVALMQEQCSKPIKTFSIGVADARFDEAARAAEYAKHLHTDHTSLRVTPEQLLNSMTAIGQMYDEPFADSSQIPTFLVSRLARESVTVALSGDGGDEVFGGYNRYLFASTYWSRFSRLPASLRKQAAKLAGLIGVERLSGVLNKLGSGSKHKNLDEKLRKLVRALDATSVADFYEKVLTRFESPGTILAGRPNGATEVISDSAMALPEGLNAAEAMMAMDAASYLPDDILTKVDRAAMSVSLETRVPFLDPDLFRFAWSLPFSFRIEGGETKRVLRQVLAKRMPHELLESPKVGFDLPLDAWLRDDLRTWVDDLLSPASLSADGTFDVAHVGTLWSQHQSGAADHTAILWHLAVFRTWQASWNGGTCGTNAA
ncbi:MAG: asparagine synthase (glutamine-hydrolyzing) [Pseudomonadota bacterium]